MTADRAAEPHPDVQRFLELYDSLETPSFDEVPVERARAMLEELRAGEPAIELESVTDRTVDGPNGEIPIRIYEPGAGGDHQRGRKQDGEREQEGKQKQKHQRPLILYFHGGGWVVGSVDSHDNTCRKLAADSGYPVVSVDYRLAPEHPFPAGLQDCYAALEWAAESAPELDADPDRIVLAGDSAGGNLAAGTALLARDQGGPAVAYQLLIYPATGDATETDSYEENREGYFLTADEMAWFRDHYFERPLDQGNVYAVPRRATDLSGLPPATIITAGFDPLRDDGEAYATRLEGAGVPVTHYNYDDLIHGFFGMITEPVAIERAHEAYDDAMDDLRSALDTNDTV